MNALRRHPWFTAWFALCLLLGGGGAWWWWRLRSLVETADQSVRQQQAELGRWEVLIGAGEPAETNAAEPVRGSSGENQAPAAPCPTSVLEAFLGLADAREEFLRTARARDIAVTAGERFGFSEYVQEGPDLAAISGVWAQLATVRKVLEKLGSAGPVQLLAVRREIPAGTGVKLSASTQRAAFVLEPRLELRESGLVEGVAVRLELIGTTGTLRKLFAACGSSPEDPVIRNVAVAPLAENVARKVGDGAVRITFDLVQLAPVWPGGATEWAAQTPGGSVWIADAQHQGGGLFTPAVRVDTGGTKPVSGGDPMAATAEAVELLAVEPELFRVQLAGCYETPAGWVALLQESGAAAVRSVRVGQRLDDQGLELREIIGKTIEVRAEDGAASRVRTMVALLRDDRAAGEVELSCVAPTLTGAWRAVLRLGAGGTRELRVGEALLVGTERWRVVRIDREPAGVEFIVSDETGAETGRRVFRPMSGPVTISQPPSIAP